jgi:hypothetical protein
MVTFVITFYNFKKTFVMHCNSIFTFQRWSKPEWVVHREPVAAGNGWFPG